ncbi:MAG: endonuclease domain-containing protein [Capsulimonadaceae bacterium]
MANVTNLFNVTATMPTRRQLRKARTPAEAVLWARLRGRQVGGMKFRRQYGVGYYVPDFYCPEAKTAIEIDGYSHTFEVTWESDEQRQRYLESAGIMVLRFTNQEVMTNPDAVILQIAAAVEARRQANQ